MSRFQDAVRRVKHTVKSSLQINNVYECARPILLVLWLFGVGGTWIRKTDGVYSVHNTRWSYLVTAMVMLMASIWLSDNVVIVFSITEEVELYVRVTALIMFFTVSAVIITVGVGCIMTLVSCKRLDTVFRIIHQIDGQLEAVNVSVKHWQVTLKVTIVLVIIIIVTAECVPRIETGFWGSLHSVFLIILFDLFYVWFILFLVILQERFSCLNKVLQQNATLTNIHVVGERMRHDDYVLRRVSLARHVHEQLTEAVHLFSDSCRYLGLGLLVKLMLQLITHALYVFMFQSELQYSTLVTCIFQTLLFTSICQANKNDRRVLAARLRHLMAFETNREVIQQVRQYIMFNAYCSTGLIDFQFTDVDNVLLFTIVDLIASNILIIYSYNR